MSAVMILLRHTVLLDTRSIFPQSALHFVLLCVSKLAFKLCCLPILSWAACLIQLCDTPVSCVHNANLHISYLTSTLALKHILIV